MKTMGDTVTNKLRNLRDDLERRDPVAFRLHLHELARRGLYDDELDALTRKSWSTGIDEDVWTRVAKRLEVLWASHSGASGG